MSLRGENMEPPIREIPGYYFDKDKRKYFKVQPSGSAPATSAYTVNDVKRRKTLEKRSTTERLQTARDKDRVKKSLRTRPDLLTGKFIARELGQPMPAEFSRILASGLVNSGSIYNPKDTFASLNPVFAVQYRPELGPSTVWTAAAWLDSLCNFRIDIDSTVPACSSIYHQPGNHFKYSHWDDEHVAQVFDPNSISLNRESHRMAVTWLTATSGAGMLVKPLNEPDDDYPPFPNQIFGPGYTRGPRVDMFSSTPAKPQSPLMFAFGSSQGILTLDKRAMNLKWITPAPGDDENCPRDVFALEFHADNPSILFSGGRRGQFHILDLRETRKFGPIPDINHWGSITHIKQIDTHGILVAGLKSVLRQYDLRYLKQEPKPPDPLSRRKVPLYRTWPTTPIINYAGFRNSANPRIGFDVDIESGIVAAAQDPGGGVRSPVQLFSLNGGNILPAPSVTQEAMLKFSNPEQTIKCIQFERDSDYGMKSLYVGGKRITRFAWSMKDDDNCP